MSSADIKKLMESMDSINSVPPLRLPREVYDAIATGWMSRSEFEDWLSEVKDETWTAGQHSAQGHY